ncbi:MAG: mechanosensitive ion channel [Bacteroidales bacterium]|nr:mechanosensitive ion channel [Bacteroidales bacterium]
MKRLIFFCTLLIIGFGVSAQSKHKHTSSADNQHLTKEITESAETRTYTESGVEKLGEMHKYLHGDADTLSSSDYMMSINRVNDKLNSIRDSATLGFEVVGMGRRIDEIANDISIIRNNVRGRSSLINVKNLYLYQSFASNLNEENDRVEARVAKIFHRVNDANLYLKTILSDSVFHVLYDDSRLRNTYDLKLVRIDRKWERADSTTRANIDTLNAMKVKIADNSVNLSNMLNLMDIRLDRANKQLFGPEVNCLWQKAQKDTIGNSSKSVISMLGSEKKAIIYYFSQTSGRRAIVLFLGILLFIWLFLKRKLIKTLREPGNQFGFLNLKYLNSYPVLSLLVVLMCLMPFFDAYAPTSYIAIEFLLLLAVTSVIFFKKGNLIFRFNWLILTGLLIADTVTYLLIEPTFVSRVWLLAIQVCIIVFSYLFYKKLPKDIPYYKWIKRAAKTGIMLSGLGVICNFSGRFSLSGIFGLASIFAVTQAVVLPVFIETLIEIILLQLQSSRMKKGFNKPFDSSIIVEKIKKPLTIIAVMLWLIMLTSNLNIYHSFASSTVELLTTTRTIGNISFRLVSVLWFFLIIWTAHILQRLISFLFGETGVDAEDTTPVSKKQHSRLLITRLLVLVGGYLLAIAASGLPVDKLTIVLGALGIGIGMGLQNVVNNFVSGIILIFDGSLQIGDEIEVSGQAGKVKEIGLRASTLSTADGADVIIPNGNILSQNIVNWTFSNDQKRVMVWFSLKGKELDANIVNETINDTIRNIPNVILQKKPVIIYTRVTPETCSITVRFWSTITNADSVKSEAMLQLSSAFAARKIEFE